MKIPTLKQAEATLGEPAKAWEGRCYEIACRFVERKLVKGIAVYGHWIGPIAKGTLFDRGLPFAHHGWVLLPDKRVLDPTRWVFEAREPYLYVGSADHYDEGGNQWREALSPQAPEFDEFDRIFDLTNEILPTQAWNYVEQLLGLYRYYDDPAYEPGTVSQGQLSWLANRSPERLGPHAPAIYRALFALGRGALIPIDNKRLVERTYGVRFTFVGEEAEDA